MADVFISYSRTDIAFAKKLHAGLTEAGLDTWIDWDDIPPSTDWLSEIRELIEQTDAFIFIISSKSVDSEICSREVTYAHENNKRLIPIVIDEIDPGRVPAFVAALNWIFFREKDDFQTSLGRLLEAIRTDQVWVKAHTRNQNRALEWERSQRAGAFLLHGSDLQEAETWLTLAQEKDPPPSELQRAYIVASRQAVTRRQRVLFGGLGLALIFAVVLSAFALVQRGVALEQSDLQATAEAQAVGEAQTRATAEAIAVAERDARATAQAESQVQRDVAVSQNLAAQSLSLTKYQLVRKLLLAVEAMQFHPGIEARRSLLEALMADFTQPFPIRTRIPDSMNFTAVAAVPDPGSSVMIAVGCAESVGLAECDQGLIQFWDSRSGEALGDPILAHANLIGSVAVSPDGSLFATSSDGAVQLWDLESRSPHGDPVTLEKPSFIDSLQFHPSGTMLAFRAISGDSKAGIFFLDSATREFIGEPLMLSDGDEADSVFDFAFSPDGERMAVTQQAWILTMWDIAQPAEPALFFSLEVEAMPGSIAYRPDGEQVAIGMHGAVMVINAKTGDVEFTPQEDAFDRAGIYTLTYSPDGAWIAALRDDEMLQLLDGASGIPIGAPLPGFERLALALARDAVAFSADGARVMVVNQRRDILFWDMDLTLWQEIACNMANRNLTLEEWELHLQEIEFRATCPQLP